MALSEVWTSCTRNGDLTYSHLAPVQVQFPASHRPLAFDPNLEPHQLLQFFEPAPANLELDPALEHDGVIPARIPDQCLDQIESHDRGSVDPKKLRRVQPLFESLHPLAYEVPLLAHEQLSVRSARDQIVDLLHWNDPHLPTHFDGDPLEVLTFAVRRCRARSGAQ